MINFLKSLLPNIITFISIGIEFVAKFLMGISVLLLIISTTLHKLLGTKLGLALIELEATTNNIVNMYNNILKQVNENKAKQLDDTNKLAAIAKTTTNVVQLGKKKNDDNKD